MKSVDEMLQDKREKLNVLDLPENLESGLQEALSKESTFSPKKKPYLIAVAALLIFFLGFNFDALAYYTKRIVGYDGVMSDTLASLNDLGKGQLIDKEITFDDGVSVSIDALMMDDSQTILFYRTNGVSQYGDIDIDLKGTFKRYHRSHGMGESDDALNQMTCVQHYDPLAFYERKLTLQVTYRGENKYESKKVTVKIDREKAMGHQLALKLDKEMLVEGQTVTFKELLITPSQTVVSGTLESPFDLALGEVMKERVEMNRLSLALIGDGDSINQLSGGYSTDHRGTTFHFEFDPLHAISQLEVQVDVLTVIEGVDETFSLGGLPFEFPVLNQVIQIESISKSGNQTHVEFTTAADVRLIGLAMVSSEGISDLVKTLEGETFKRESGLYHRRTMVFEGNFETFDLHIDEIQYDKSSDASCILWSE